MNKSNRINTHLGWALALASWIGTSSAFAQAPVPVSLQPGAMVGICGDSITQQKLYSVYIEDYLTMCQPALSLKVAQFGLGGETSTKFLVRMKNDVLPFKPTVATLFYGMNDGGYVASDPAHLDAYKKAMTDIVQTFKSNGVKFIVVGSPGVVDNASFKRNDPSVYNKTLSDLGDVARAVATDQGVTFTDVHAIMENAMTRAKAKYGDAYHFAGDDGIHPGPNGHIAIAYAFLKALGCSGDIGTITLDFKANTATGTDGQKILTVQNGSVAIESTRYPFCFYGDPAKPDSTRGTIEFVPFNQDLNRYLLIVKNGPAGNMKVTWGDQSKIFLSSDLEKGVNLAAEFLDNPFNAPFTKVENAIRHQQDFETSAVQDMLHSISNWTQSFPDQQSTFDQFKQSISGIDDNLRQTAAATVTPVQHTIKVEVAN